MLEMAFVAACLALFVFGVGSASAETFHATSTQTLEEAVAEADANGVPNTIELAGGHTYLPSKTLIFTNTGGTQTLTGPAGTLGVNGPEAKMEGAHVQTVTGVSEKELITVKPGVSVTMEHLVITTGGTSFNATIEDFGTLDVETSTISGNTGNGVIVHSGAGLATFTNSTISDGLADGIINEEVASFFNDTVVQNKGTGIGGAGTLNLTNTIVANNGSTGSKNCEEPATTSDHSLDNGTSCGVGALSSTAPKLEVLLNDGGSTPVHSEQPGSPTIGAGDSAKCPATDQRGYSRSTACDIGADEYSATPPSITVPKEIITSATGPSGAPVSYTVEASDSDGLVTSLNCTPASGSTFPVGTTKVECTATDGHENTAKASFKVTVTATAAPPVITSVTPNEGPETGGTTVTIKGEHLETATEAKFGTTPATELKTISPTEITVKNPAHTPGTIDVTITTPTATSTTTTADHFTYKQANSAEARLRDLLKEVRSSKISHHIRQELSCLLSDALRSLAGLSGYGPSKCGAALLSSRQATTKAGRESRHPSACEDLQQFVEVIEHDQHSRRPKIPAKLAKAWSAVADDIEASLGCTSHDKPPGHSSRHAHGHNGHRSNHGR
jgi:hypothetical protein